MAELAKDKIDFGLALKQLHDDLLRDYNSDMPCIVVSLSRKGPKILETVFSEKELQQFDVITEIALPCFFLMRKHEHRHYRVYVVDDAVYYGSTLLNLYNELQEYAKVAGLELDIQAYVALKDWDMLQIDGLQINGMKSKRRGYGHFFVKEVMKRFRKSHRCMEVEYPVVNYRLNQELDAKQLAAELMSRFDGYYEVKHEEGNVLCTLLPQNSSQFSKMRIYPDKEKMSVAIMSPWNIPDDEQTLESLMNDMGYGYNVVWQKITDDVLHKGKKLLSATTFRNLRRSMVVLANYIYSYQVFLYYMRTIEDALYACGIDSFNKGIDRKDLYRLTGSEEIVGTLIEKMSEQSHLLDMHFPNSLPMAVKERGLVYEEDNFPDIDERQNILLHNEHMVRNSHSYQEALSAQFFNQNLFIERWSRMKARYEGRRLWFGYTHDSLSYQLERNGRYKKPQNQEKQLHKWVDMRIDQGCVVPQYVLDPQKDVWVRVLRPGENEDVLLSHLARFVIHVYNLIDEKMELGYVPIDFLNGILAVVYQSLWVDCLQEQFDFTLILDDDRTLRLAEFDVTGSPEIINYLRRMYILEVNDDEVTISPRITDHEFRSQTTMDSDAVRRLDKLVGEVMERFSDSGLSYRNSETIFNHYLNKYLPVQTLEDVCHHVGTELIDVTNHVKDSIEHGQSDFFNADTENQMIEAYHEVMRYSEDIAFYLQNGMATKEYWQKYNSDRRFRALTEMNRVIYVVNILASVYALKDYDGFSNFAEMYSNKSFFALMRLENLQTCVMDIIRQGNFDSAHHNIQLISVMQDILTETSKL